MAPGDRPAPPGRQDGFTLIEALVALLVVGLAVAGSLQAVSRALGSQAQATRHAEAAALAESRMNQVGLMDVDSLRELDGARWRTRALAGRRYRQRSWARSLEDENLWRVTTQVEWSDGRVELETVFFRPPGQAAQWGLQ